MNISDNLTYFAGLALAACSPTPIPSGFGLESWPARVGRAFLGIYPTENSEEPSAGELEFFLLLS
jgi:hypothetical protein